MAVFLRLIGCLCFMMVLCANISEGSGCPVASRPHPSDCRRFYRCVTLPASSTGYVWVPSKCPHNTMYQSELRMCVMPGNQEMSHLCRPNYDPMPEFPMTSITTHVQETNEYGSGEGDADSSEYDSSYDSEPAEEDEPELYMQFITSTTAAPTPLPPPRPTEDPVMRIIAQQLQKITQLIESLQQRPAPPQEPTAAQLNHIVAENQAQSQPWPVQSNTMPQPLPSDGMIPSDQMQQILEYQYSLQELSEDRNKILSLGSGPHQFVSYNQYKDSILPVLQGAPVQVLPCTAGIRQPNLTDCTRYYVCNQESATVFMFECPRQTAFNRDTRICTAGEFDKCRNGAAMMMMSQTLQRPAQHYYQQPMQQMMQRPVQQQMYQQQQYAQQPMQVVMQHQPLQQPMRQQQQLQPQLIGQPNKQQSPQVIQLMKEKTNDQTAAPSPIRCAQLGKLPDPNSVSDYYVCYRTKSGAIEGHKMTCQKPLTFCAKNSVCTTSERCV